METCMTCRVMDKIFKKNLQMSKFFCIFVSKISKGQKHNGSVILREWIDYGLGLPRKYHVIDP